MRLYQQHIRSAVLDGALSNSYLHEPDLWRGRQELFRRVFAGCEANRACAQAYPNIRRLFYDLLDELSADPIVIDVPDFLPEPIAIRVDGFAFFRDEAFFLFPETIQQMFAEIWRATHGELEGVYRDGIGVGPFVSEADLFVAEGKTQSYRCRDLVSFVTRADLIKAARELPWMASYLLGPDYGWPTAPEGCRIWGAGRAEPAQHRPVKSRIPALVLAGEIDASVPPLITRRIPRTLPNSFYFEFPASGHLQLPTYQPVSECARRITDRFLDAPREDPEARCFGRLPKFDYTPPDTSASARHHRGLRLHG